MLRRLSFSDFPITEEDKTAITAKTTSPDAIRPMEKKTSIDQPLAWTNSPSQALLLTPAVLNRSDHDLRETGSGVALFHSNSIPFLSQALHLAFVNTVNTIRGVYSLTRGIPS